MKDFNELCRSVEELSPLEYAAVLGRTSLKIMPAIRAFSEDGRTCAEVLAAFVIASVYADGKLDESEYLLMAPLLKAFFGEDFDFEDAKKLAKEWRKDEVLVLVGAVRLQAKALVAHGSRTEAGAGAEAGGGVKGGAEEDDVRLFKGAVAADKGLDIRVHYSTSSNISSRNAGRKKAPAWRRTV